ncbi:hypothetical protein [Falsiroseomonas sp.]|uniref:bestrophin-like domain n=1 Tax=Falsiroseomonas sp. TaxID=2870721 RepID=UPI0034A36E6C
MPNWLLEILDPLPLPTAAMYFSLFFLVVAWTGVIFVRPFFRLWLRSQARLNEVVTAASAGFYLFYGLLLGLLSVAAYSNARDISGFAGREAAELVSIYRSTTSYPEAVREEVRHLLRDYTVYVVDREWPSYQEGRVPLGGYNRLQAIRETLLAFEPQTRTQEITHTSVLKSFNDMVTLRQQRLAGVDASIPGALWYTVAIGGLITVVFLLLLDMRLGLHLFTTGMITTFLGLMVFIIYAQDRPLRNEIGASAAPFAAAYEMVMRWDDTP